ncbi:hypothetical protein [Streptomyces tateyamensis]|uniref:hypothetical protein n=1 Tax=Streptomyces tateyamensis TaxID=565073 RepID=UPI001FE9AC70|nr:hypothetical protein [Streptomyces tateyamensis]
MTAVPGRDRPPAPGRGPPRLRRHPADLLGPRRQRHWGYATTGEYDEDGGRAQNYQHATIHWHPAKGTWITTP